MRIGLFTDTFPPQINGVANSTYILQQELKRHGHDVFVITTNSDGMESEWNEDHTILYLGGIELKFLYGYIMTSPFHLNHMNDIRDLKLDVIHTQTEFGVGLFGRICASQFNIPLVATYHTTYEDYTHYVNLIHSRSVDHVAKKAVAELSKLYGDSVLRLIAPSEKTKALLEGYHIHTKIEVIPTGLEIRQFSRTGFDETTKQELRRKCGLKEEEKLIIYVGRLAQEKALDIVIDGFLEVKRRGLPVKLLIVGDGPDFKVLQKQIKKEELEEYVILAGAKPKEEIPSYYLSSDAFVSASLSETQGMTFIEALASGLPLFARKDDVLEELLIQDQTGWYFENAAGLADRLEAFAALPNDVLESMRQSCAAHALQYDSVTFCERVMQVYQDAIAEYKDLYMIEDILIKDNTIKLFLSTRSGMELRVSVAMDDYYNLGLRKNETLTNEKLKELQDKEEGVIAYQNCLKKIALKDRTRKEIYDWLTQNTKCSIENINAIIRKLEEKGYIDDERYCDEKIAAMTSMLFGKQRIIRDLKKKGISAELIQKKLENREDKEDTAKEYALKILDSEKRGSVRELKTKVITKLIQRGFSAEIARRVGEEMDYSRAERDEVDNLRQCALKAKRRYERKYSASDLRNHIYRYCAAKGYNSEDIYAVLDEMEWNDEED